MNVHQKIPTIQVVGPLGKHLRIEDLPSPSTNRWTARRKAEVVAAVNGGLLSLDEACERYSLSLEELIGWQRAEERGGMMGLRSTKLKHYREVWERKPR